MNERRLSFARFVQDELHQSVDKTYQAILDNDPERIRKLLRLMRVQLKDLENTIKEDDL